MTHQTKMESSKNHLMNNASYLQYLSAFTALLGGLCMGSVLSYTSPAIPSMINESNSTLNTTNDEHNHFYLDDKDSQLISWIISTISIGGLVGSIFAGTICELIGIFIR